MTSFDSELHALIEEWIKLGDNPETMADAMMEEAARLMKARPATNNAK